MPHVLPVRRLTAAILAGMVCLSACSGASATPTPSPSPSPTPDPQTMVARSLSNLAGAGSFHVAGKITGSIDMAQATRLFGLTIGLSGKLALDGGTVAADVDVARQAAHMTVEFPSIFGLTIDLIEVGGTTYTKIDLLSDRYAKRQLDPQAVAGALPGAGLVDPSAILALVLGTPGTILIPTGETTVDGRQAYGFALSVAPQTMNDELRSFVPGIPEGVSLDGAGASYAVYADTLLPATLDVTLSSSALGSLGLELTFDAYGQPVTIETPAPGEIEG